MIKMSFDALFKPSKLERAVERKERRVLFQVGAYGRKVMRSTIRRSKKTSLPGRPPNSQTGILKVTMAFEVKGSSDVVIGPKISPGVRSLSAKPVPQLLQEGGMVKASKVRANTLNVINKNKQTVTSTRTGKELFGAAARSALKSGSATATSGKEKQIKPGDMMKYRPRPYAYNKFDITLDKYRQFMAEGDLK